MTDYIVGLVGIDHVGIGMEYWMGQAGVASDEVANKLYKYFLDSGQWTVDTYPPPPW